MTNKCKHGYELGPGNRCVKKKGKGSGNTAKKAEIVGRTLAAILTWGGSEALIRADKKAKADKKTKSVSYWSGKKGRQI
jgi:hypothetical protein